MYQNNNYGFVPECEQVDATPRLMSLWLMSCALDRIGFRRLSVLLPREAFPIVRPIYESVLVLVTTPYNV